MASFALRQKARSAGPSTHGPRRLLARLRARLLRYSLDRDIARGTEHSADPVVALREAQLVSSQERERLAHRLEQLMDASPLGTLGGVIRVDANAVEVAAPVLTELILALRSSEAVAARGVVLAWRLLTDPTSPVYVPPGHFADPDRLWNESLAVLLALRPTAVGGVATR
jgi:hypothetical protein